MEKLQLFLNHLDFSKKSRLAFGVIPARRTFELFMERYRSCTDHIKDHMQTQVQKSPLKILDVGAGEGYLAYFLHDVPVEMHGIEHNPVRAQACRNLGYTVAEFDLSQRAFPWPDNAFDVVVASHVIEHLPNVTATFKEMDRVLRRGGLLVVGTPTKPPGLAEICQRFRSRFQHAAGDTQRSYSSRSLVKECLNSLQWPKESLIDVRGFRLISARKWLPLEDYKWFYRISTLLGKKLLFLVPEVNAVFKKI